MGQVIDFNNHSINLVRKIEALLLPLLAIIHYLVEGLCQLNIWVDRKSPITYQLQGLRLRIEIHPLHIANLIPKEIEMAGGCNASILLTQGAGRGIARIGEELIIFHLLIQLLKTFVGLCVRFVYSASSLHRSGHRRVWLQRSFCPAHMSVPWPARRSSVRRRIQRWR